MTDLIEPSAAAAVLDASQVAFATMLGGLPGATRHGDGGLWWVDTGVPDSAFNGVYMAPDSGDDDEYAAGVAEVVTYFRRRGLPFRWQVGLRPEPVDAREILLGNGLRHVEDEPGMWLDLASVGHGPPAVRGLEIRPVRGQDTLREWMRVWGSPAPSEVEHRWYELYRQLPYGPDGDLRMFLGYLDGTPVATCCLFRAGSVAALHHVVTDPDYRHRGIGAAMTDAAIRQARHAGCRIAVLTSSPYGVNIYRGLGFGECCLVGTYEWHPRG